MNFKKTLILLNSIILICCSCSSTTNSTEEAKYAISIADSLLNAIKEKQFELLPTLYAEEFYSKITKNEWDKDLQKIDSIGKGLQTFELKNVNIENDLTGGDYVFLEYNVKYQNINTVQTLILIKQKPSYKIKAHNIKIF